MEILTSRVLLSAVNPLPLASLNGTNGFRIDGVTAGDNSGFSVSAAGDINGDGFDDVIIGANNAAPGGNISAGSSYVVFGKAGGFTSAISLSGLDGTNGFRLDGDEANVDSGISVSSAGDINGDGFGDLVVGAPRGIGSGAASYVVFGKLSGFASVINVSGLDGSNGFQITGPAPGHGFGHSVSSAGDVNGDGFDDLVLGAYLDSNQAGSSYILFGKSGGFASSISVTTLDGTSGFRLDGIGTIDWSGSSVSHAGDVNGDGFDDLIIGAFQAWPNDVVGAGSAFVVFGNSGGFTSAISLSTLDGTNGFRLDGVSSSAQAGKSVSSAGDVNGDGFDDLIIGSPVADPAGNFFAGTSYVVFGKSAGFTSAINLATLDGTNGFKLNGANFDVSGSTVSGAGDVNGDGFDDVIVGNGSVVDAGNSYLVFGKSGGFSSEITLSALNGTIGFRINGAADDDRAGTSVSRAGDVNGDGFDDLIVGAYLADPGGNSGAGSSYIIFGGNFTGGVETKVGTSGGETLTANRGAAAVDVLIGGQGNDILISDGGSDVLIGGEGDDILVIPDTNFSGTRRLLGGTGKNTLRLDGSGLALDLTLINDNRIVDIDEIDITGSGPNTLTLDMLEVLNISSHSNSLIVRQDADDIINFGTGWTESGFETVGGSVFKVLTQGAATLKVQVQAHSPTVTNAATSEDVQSSSGLVISRNAADGTEVTHFKITGISGGTLFQNDGTSQINDDDFITFAQANAGLKFTPTPNSFATGHFSVQASLSNVDSGLSGTPVIADIAVSAVADTPSVTNASTFTNTQTLAGLVIGRNAADGVEVTYFKITGITGGALFQNNGTSQINNGEFITFAQAAAGLKFSPNLNSNVTGHFTVQASTSNVDGGLGGSTVTADVIVRTPPGVPSVTNASTNEDVQTSSGLVISRNAIDGAEITYFRITSITGGTLFLNDGVSQINDGDFITSADATAGLKFTPALNSNVTGHFTVQAAISNIEGGAGGATVTADITVDAVADTPKITNASTDIDMQTTSGLVISRDEADGPEVTHFKITGITGGTVFQNDGTSQINDGDFITFAEASAGLKFTPTLNSTSTGHFTVQASTSNLDSGLGGDTVTATVLVKPPVPVITEPVTSTPNPRPVIRWTAVPGAESYVIYIRNLNGGANSVILRAVTETSYTPTADLEIGTSDVRVRAISASGATSQYSGQHNLNITVPAVFSGATRFQATVTPGLTWAPITGAVKYDLWINNLTTGEQQVVRNTSLTGTSWVSPENLPMGGYRAWIRGVNSSGTSATWSRAFDFFVLPVVSVVSPLISTFDTTPTFTWDAVPGATGYDLYVRNLVTGKFVSSPKDIVGTSFTPPANLAPGNYRWWVYAVTQGDYHSQAATTQDIEVGMSPTLLTPGESTTDQTPTFSWNAVTGAATYNLFVSRLDVATRAIIDDAGIAETNFTPVASLPVGSYRAWMRATSLTGETGPWSAPYDFTITVTVDAPVTVPDDLLRSQLTMLNEVSLQHRERSKPMVTDVVATDVVAASQKTAMVSAQPISSGSEIPRAMITPIPSSMQNQVFRLRTDVSRRIGKVEENNLDVLMAELASTDLLLLN